MKAMELEIGKKYQDIEITPSIFGQWYDLWIEAMDRAEHYYMELTKLGCPAQLARNVLPNSLKTELWLTMNLRNWRHFFQLRAAGTTGKPHPQMQELAVKMLKAFKDFIPIVFDDIIVGG
jgi:thymidylate synthase (FAD)